MSVTVNHAEKTHLLSTFTDNTLFHQVSNLANMSINAYIKLRESVKKMCTV